MLVSRYIFMNKNHKFLLKKISIPRTLSDFESDQVQVLHSVLCSRAEYIPAEHSISKIKAEINRPEFLPKLFRPDCEKTAGWRLEKKLLLRISSVT